MTHHQSHYERMAELHVRDLFNGGYGEPARRRKPKAKKSTKRKRAPAPLPKPIKPPKHFAAIECPCCKRPVGVPDIQVLIDYYDIPPMEQAILQAVWRGKGYPVSNERIFNVMYADHPDGGPPPSSMYTALKVSLCHLRARLRGSGVSIENAGYRRGYRLVLTGV